MARSSREQTLRTLAEIRDAARTLFADEGYAAVSLERVAARAGVTRGAVYHHFEGKDALFRWVVEDAQSTVAAAIERAAPGVGWEALEVGSVAYLRAVVAPDVRRILLVDAPSVLGWSEWRRIDGDHSGALLRDVLSELPGLAVDPSAAAAVLNGAMNEAGLWIAAGGDPASAEGAVLRVIRSLRL